MENAKILTRDDILGADDINLEQVEVPEWGGVVYVKPLSGIQRDRLENAAHKRTRKGVMDVQNLKVQFVIASVVDSDGSQIFTPSDAKDLNQKNARPIDALFQVVQRLSGLSDEDVEELVGNFGSGRSIDSGSVLPPSSE